MDIKIEKRIHFILETDKVKNIIRQNYIADGSKRENDAEHSWHLALMALVLRDYFPPDIDLLKVITMVIIHDLVEIDAGDTYLYGNTSKEEKFNKELEAAKKIFSLLDSDLEEEFYGLWIEFEDNTTKEAQFANVLDRLQPVLLNHASKGKTWLVHGIQEEQVRTKNDWVKTSPKVLSDLFETIIQDAVEKGFLN